MIKFLNFFLRLYVIFALLDSIESGSNSDPDPQPWRLDLTALIICGTGGDDRGCAERHHSLPDSAGCGPPCCSSGLHSSFSQFSCKKHPSAKKSRFCVICDIFVQIRIRGSVPLTYGSGSYFFRQWLTRCQQKISFFAD
jgi:hypothetical protein